MIKKSFKNTDSDMKKENKYEYESWEYENSLLESKDFKELIRFRKFCLKQQPTDEHLKWKLGDAYILNGEYEKALNYLRRMYKESFGNGNVEYSILDALYALGRDENDFEWIEKPIIIKIFEVANICYEHLKRKRESVSIDELYCDLLIKAYLPFDVLELYNELKIDERFEIVEDRIVYTSMVKVVKRKKEENKI